METYRRRIRKIREYSGYNEVTEGLRNRIILVLKSVVRDTSNVPMFDPYDNGEDQTTIELSYIESKLNNEYGRTDCDLYHFLKKGLAEDVFTVVEIITAIALENFYGTNYFHLVNGLAEAFELSGSVYSIEKKSGLVILKLSEDIIEELSSTVHILSDYDRAKQLLKNAISGLISREQPEIIVRDSYLAMENYFTAMAKTEGKNAFILSLNKIFKDKPVQKQIASNLKGFKGNAKGVSHEGSYVIDESDAVWFVRSISAMIELAKTI